MIECKRITVTKGNRRIVENVSFTARDGEITVILGKNGSGKTTLLRCIASSVRYSGEILLNGESIKKLPASKRSRLIALMTQNLPDVAVEVEKLVSFGRYPYTGITGVLSPSDRRVVKECIIEARIESLSGAMADKISGGEKRKAFFAMMLCQKAPVILLDEPTANLDNEYIGHITDMIEKRKAAKDTVIVVLHDINHAIKIADKIVVMDGGRTVFEGCADEFTKSDIPEKLFGAEKCVCIDKDGNKSVIYR